MMQKLVTIHLTNYAYAKGELKRKGEETHGFVEEHLQEYLNDGWVINSVTGLGGGTEYTVSGWVIVLLEKK